MVTPVDPVNLQYIQIITLHAVTVNNVSQMM